MEHSILDTTSEHILSNGLKVICFRKTSAPVVSVQIWYKTGSANERPGIRGVSHMLEHMMFRGSANVGSEEHARRINDIGGHCNAFTAEDVCAYINSVPKDYLDMVFTLEADRMAGLTLDAELLETERKVIVEEYHTYMNNPVAKAFLEFRKSFFGEHPYALGPLGELDDIKSITVDDCSNYFKQNYHPSNAVVVVVGDIESRECVFELAEKRFGRMMSPSLPPGKSSKCMLGGGVCEANGVPGWMKRVVEFDVPMLIVGFPAPASASCDALPLDILQMIVSQGESSRLNREVVRRHSVAVMAGGMNHFLRLSGMSLFFAAFTPDISPRRVLEAIEREISGIVEKGISEFEIEKIRNTMLTGRALEMYSAEHICHRLGYSETIDGDFRLWIERIGTLKNISRQDLLAVAQSYWDCRKRYALYLKPKKIQPALFLMGLARKVFAHR